MAYATHQPILSQTCHFHPIRNTSLRNQVSGGSASRLYRGKWRVGPSRCCGSNRGNSSGPHGRRRHQPIKTLLGGLLARGPRSIAEAHNGRP